MSKRLDVCVEAVWESDVSVYSPNPEGSERYPWEPYFVQGRVAHSACTVGAAESSSDRPQAFLLGRHPAVGFVVPHTWVGFGVLSCFGPLASPANAPPNKRIWTRYFAIASIAGMT